MSKLFFGFGFFKERRADEPFIFCIHDPKTCLDKMGVKKKKTFGIFKAVFTVFVHEVDDQSSKVLLSKNLIIDLFYKHLNVLQ